MQIKDGKRAIQESKAMQELKHPFVVTLHFAFQVNAVIEKDSINCVPVGL